MFRNTQGLRASCIWLTLLALPGCKTAIDTSASIVSSVVATTTTATPVGTTVTITAPPDTAYQSVTFDLGSQFLATNICSTATIAGLAGTGSCSVSGTSTVAENSTLLRSNMFRTVGTTQISQLAETTTYSGNGSSANLATSLTNYREIPVVNTDDEGYYNSDVACVTCTPVVAISSAQHAAFVNCGTTQTTIAARIAHCSSLNGSTATWNGATSGTGGAGKWSLVTRSAASKEVWQDQTTGLLWSSIVAQKVNWCLASGNSQAADAATCGSATYQPSTQSFCAEGPTSIPAAGTCSTNPSGVCLSAGTCPSGTCAAGVWTATTENWTTGIYDSAKGGMGANTSGGPKVRWRLPTIADYFQADVDGLRYVLPDIGALKLNNNQEEWSSTVLSSTRTSAFTYQADTLLVDSRTRTFAKAVRCVGR